MSANQERSVVVSVLKNPFTIILSVVSGVAIGLWAKPVAEQLAPIGQLYLHFIQMSVFPILIVAIASSLASMIRNKAASRSIAKMVLVFLLFFAVVSAAGVAIGALAGPGRNLDKATMATLGKIVSDPAKSSVLEVNILSEGDSAPKQKKGLGFLGSLVPKNIFESLSDGKALEIVFFAIIFGIALGFIREQAANQLITLTVSIFEAFQKLIGWAMLALPLGLVCLISDQIANVGIDIFVAMLKFIAIFYAGGTLLFLIATVVVWVRSGIANPLRVLKALVDPMVISLATRSSFAALPSSITAMEEKLGFDGNQVNLILPLGTTLGRYGNVFYFAIASFFVTQIYGVSMEGSSYLLVAAGSIFAGIATAGSTGLITLSMIGIVLTPLGLPVEAILIIFMAIDTIVDPMRTFLIVYVNIAATSLVAKRLDASTIEDGEGTEGTSIPAEREAAAEPPSTMTRTSLEEENGCAAKKDIYRVALVARDLPPFVSTGEDGQPTGLDIRIIQEFARRQDIDLEFIRDAKDRDGVLELLSCGGADLGVSRISRGSGTDSRAFLSVPYLAVKTKEGKALMSVAVTRDAPRLAEAVDKFITDIRAEGFVEALIADAKK